MAGVWRIVLLGPLGPHVCPHCPPPPCPPLVSPRPPAPQSITALAHLRCAVLYIVDISEQCGFTIAQQAALFHSIKPLFSNKPVLIVANKTDVVKLEALSGAGGGRG